jgi:hypothetical protein
MSFIELSLQYIFVMFGFTSSQTISIVVLVASVVLYFCGLTYSQQNVWLFVFSVAMLCLIVGNCYGM